MNIEDSFESVCLKGKTQGNKKAEILLQSVEAQGNSEMMNSHSISFQKFVDSSGLGFTQKELSKLMYYVQLDEDSFFTDGDEAVDFFLSVLLG